MKKTVKKAASTARDNPKTTVAGMVGIGALIASLWAPPEYQGKIQGTISLLTSSGLIFGAIDPKKKQ